MELKDMILQTLTEIEDTPKDIEVLAPSKTDIQISKDEFAILHALREKTLVLFEGLQSLQTKNLSGKLDLVINYLQYQLSIIDEKLGN
ncbi:hypothetical protein [Helicobacter sp. 11S03491-1]|uniref:CiaD-like domain-containing protein n=1 Tax=Helicobacter sp. 11S03491-1 TaxID=1476196 RepID=UPI000BA69DE0|nr:hypothetical protein [Helicobacter sp. 11S03491-1]PAF41242.1 hypothetical protein BKH45_07725 [Helicobacter sp. 11S03491-1]